MPQGSSSFSQHGSKQPASPAPGTAASAPPGSPAGPQPSVVMSAQQPLEQQQQQQLASHHHKQLLSDLVAGMVSCWPQSRV